MAKVLSPIQFHLVLSFLIKGRCRCGCIHAYMLKILSSKKAFRKLLQVPVFEKFLKQLLKSKQFLVTEVWVIQKS